MPEFHLDRSGDVSGVTCRDLNDVETGYIEALFFTEEGDGEPGTDNESGLWRKYEDSEGGEWVSDFGFSDLAPEALDRIRADCRQFMETPAYKAFDAWRDADDSPDTSPASDEQVGHDLWFNRNGHGVGFWSRPDHYYGPHADALEAAAKALGEVWPYVGDDGSVHL